MALHLYPVQPNEIPCKDYMVTIGGKAVPLDTARVSAIPYNRRWPGHQRPLDQTELINFLSLAMDEPLDFEITPAQPFEQVKIRPASLGIKPEVTERGTIRFTLPRPAYFTVEPYGRQHALHIFADPLPTYHIAPTDAQLRYFGPGEHDAGQIELHSGDTLYLDEGAVVYACVSATDADNIRILGRGILDNSRNKAKILYEANVEENDTEIPNAQRQNTIQLEYCTHVEIDGITIRGSLVYNIRLMACRDLTIRHVKIIGCWRYNSDGIDMHNCQDVLIDRCFLRTFDDSICVKGFDCYYEGDVEAAVQAAMYRGGQAYDVFRHVRVTGCVIWNDWGKALEIGAETRAEEIADVVFEDCDCIHITGPALDCCNVDYADVHHITWRDIRVEMDEIIPESRIQSRDSTAYGEIQPGYAPPVICANVIFHHEYSAGGARRGQNRDLLFENIQILGDVKPVFDFLGYSEAFGCRDILIRDVYVNGKLLKDPSEYRLQIGPHCQNIRYEHSAK